MGFLCLIGTAAIDASAQQDPHFSQYMHNKLFMNPGYAGMKHALCFTAIARNQWQGFDGAPKSGVFSGDIYLEQLHGGVGVNILYDQLGFERNLVYRMNYSYHLEEILGGTLGIGIEGGGVTKSLGPTGSQSWIATTNWQTDLTVPPTYTSHSVDLGLGIWYERSNLWFGLSTTHLAPGKYDEGFASVGNTQHTLRYDVAHHYFITGGYNLATRSWVIQPSFLVKSDAVVSSVDLNCTAVYNDRVWFGVSYRVNDAISPMIGFNWVMGDNGRIPNRDSYDGRLGAQTGSRSIQMLRVGFAYDWTTSPLRSYNNGTFELFANYCIPWSPRTSRHGDVRIFN